MCRCFVIVVQTVWAVVKHQTAESIVQDRLPTAQLERSEFVNHSRLFHTHRQTRWSPEACCPLLVTINSTLFHTCSSTVALYWLQQRLYPLACRMMLLLPATLHPCWLSNRRQQEGSESPRRDYIRWLNRTPYTHLFLLKEPSALTTECHESLQLCSVNVFANVEARFERVLDVQRGWLWFVLLFSLERIGLKMNMKKKISNFFLN